MLIASYQLNLLVAVEEFFASGLHILLEFLIYCHSCPPQSAQLHFAGPRLKPR